MNTHEAVTVYEMNEATKRQIGLWLSDVHAVLEAIRKVSLQEIATGGDDCGYVLELFAHSAARGAMLVDACSRMVGADDIGCPDEDLASYVAARKRGAVPVEGDGVQPAIAKSGGAVG